MSIRTRRDLRPFYPHDYVLYEVYIVIYGVHARFRMRVHLAFL